MVPEIDAMSAEFEIDRSVENEDIMMVTKQLQALKVLSGVNSRSEQPMPDYTPSFNSEAFASVSETNSEDGSASPKGNRNGNSSSSSSNSLFHRNPNDPKSNGNGNNFSKSLFDQVQSLFQQPPQEVDHVGYLINKQMLKYDINQRNAIYEEVHGVGSLSPEESPAMIESALKNLDRELEAIPAKQRMAYDRSKRTPHSYVHTPNFRLRFLRAELFDAQRAANRMTLFLLTCLEIYGPQTLVRPIRVSDFSRTELKGLNAGRIQLLPYRDRGGRRVIVGIPNNQNHSLTALTRLKIHMYLWWIASHDVETQRKGVVFIVFHNPKISDAASTMPRPTPAKPAKVVSAAAATAATDSDSAASSGSNDVGDDREEQQGVVSGIPNLNFMKFYVNRRRALASRMVAFHTCTPDTPFYSIIRSINTAMVDDRCRVKHHIGDDVECRYKLSGFGIPLDQLPITESGKIKNTHFKKWLQLRKNIEDPGWKHRDEVESIVECPGLNDVVFRPSQSTMCHPGNVMFRSLVESKHYAHSVASSREAKVEITQSVISEVRNRGGRFLVWSNDMWWTEILDEKLIYAKIAVYFRNSKVSAKAKINRQTTKSSTYIFTDKRRKIEFDCGSSRSEPCFGFV